MTTVCMMAGEFQLYSRLVGQAETAIEKLLPQKVEELAAWLDEYRQTTHASDAIFSLYDGEASRPS